MSQILYINILADWSSSGIMTSKLVIRESFAASSILISRMMSSLVIIPYINTPLLYWRPLLLIMSRLPQRISLMKPVIFGQNTCIIETLQIYPPVS